MRTVASILWRWLHQEGHDACLLSEASSGWNLRGHALFVQDGKPCSLAYEVDCDADWYTRSARADGFLGTQELHYGIDRLTERRWTLNGEHQAEVDGLIDVDLGFTPATNLLALRRFALDVGMATPAPAAYLTFPELRLVRLKQSYQRVDAAHYAYEAPMFGYNEMLEVSPIGFVLDYPRLWRATAQPG